MALEPYPLLVWEYDTSSMQVSSSSETVAQRHGLCIKTLHALRYVRQLPVMNVGKVVDKV
jgi:hypothetical protein